MITLNEINMLNVRTFKDILLFFQNEINIIFIFLTLSYLKKIFDKYISSNLYNIWFFNKNFPLIEDIETLLKKLSMLTQSDRVSLYFFHNGEYFLNDLSFLKLSLVSYYKKNHIKSKTKINISFCCLTILLKIVNDYSLDKEYDSLKWFFPKNYCLEDTFFENGVSCFSLFVLVNKGLLINVPVGLILLESFSENITELKEENKEHFKNCLLKLQKLLTKNKN